MSNQPLAGPVVEQELELSVEDLCRLCGVEGARVVELVEEGIVEPQGRDRENWRFRGVSISRVRCAVRLQRDLGVNLAGAALALELLEELNRLRARLQRLE